MVMRNTQHFLGMQIYISRHNSHAVRLINSGGNITEKKNPRKFWNELCKNSFGSFERKGTKPPSR